MLFFFLLAIDSNGYIFKLGKSCCDLGDKTNSTYPSICSDCWTSSLSLLKGDLDGTANICTLAEHCNSSVCTEIKVPQPQPNSKTCNHFGGNTCCTTTAPDAMLESARNGK